ncbi:MAG: response regulator [Elusimicrobia bacterium]|nr:response regulator [Elusimicrobiota bacterium]
MEKTKILIVEDESIVAEDLSESLSDLGYIIMGIAETAEDAIRKAEEFNPELILMDIMLKGGKTGIDAALEIRKKSDIPIVYVTAYSDSGSVKKAEATGPAAYIVKPVDINKLVDCIELIFLKRKRKMELKLKKEELDKEKDPEKRALLEKEVADVSKQVEIQNEQRMIFVDS